MLKLLQPSSRAAPHSRRLCELSYPLAIGVIIRVAIIIAVAYLILRGSRASAAGRPVARPRGGARACTCSTGSGGLQEQNLSPVGMLERNGRCS